MKRVLILAVDRDDDFGSKACVQTPAVGISAVKDAAVRLGSADPEDSDVNSLFSAIQMYNDLVAEGKDAHIALICGDRKVGHVSDAAIVEELEEVLEEVRPNSVILVSDGSEDEFVYPIISSRVHIDSVRKVYVKQALGLEGSLYLMYKFMRDADKKRRFLAPLGWSLILLGFGFMIPNILMFFSSGDADYLYKMTGSMAVMLVGIVFIVYAYDLLYRLHGMYVQAVADFKSGSLKIIFAAISMAMLVFGIIVAVLAMRTVYDSSWFHNAIVFVSNFLWFFVFALILANLGTVIEQYIMTKMVVRPFVIGTITVLALAFIVMGILDIVNSTVGYAYVGETVIVYELVVGVVFGLCATMIHASFREFDPGTEDVEGDAVR